MCRSARDLFYSEAGTIFPQLLCNLYEMDISCFQVQQWSYATIWVSLAQCTSQKERSRSNAKLSHKADSRKMDEADLPFVSCVELCSVMCPRRCYTCSDWNSSKMTDCTACAFFFISLSPSSSSAW